ncbi:MAG: NAD(P)/FAD-dependent oxidoreductase [Prevotella sp.]|nr:NAD(P)/FAD-dependent oxidoreductase [Prevotella sp.]
MKQVIIIGAGLGGLFTAAILAKEGFQVTVLEKNSTIGGGLQNFSRFGVTFDTGMHVIGGMQPGENIRRICEYLGIAGEIKLRDVDNDCTDCLFFAEDKKRYRIARGKSGFVESLCAEFPSQRENLQRYVKALYDLVEKIDLFNLRPSTGGVHLFAASTDFMLSANAFISKYITDKRLACILAYFNPLYGGRYDQTPAFVHAIINVLYINGPMRFVGGSAHMADLLAKVVTDHGGSVLTRHEVEWIEINNRRVEYVRTKDGSLFKGDHYICAIHPCSLFRMMADGALPKAYRNRLDSIPNAHSAFSLFIKLKERSFPYINHTEYYMTRYDEIWDFDNPAAPWPLGFLFMTPPETQRDEWASKAIITAPMLFEEVRQWANTRVGRRGEDYERWKQQKAAQVLAKVEEMHPGFAQCIEAVNTASPLTIRDFFNVKEGSICGFSKNVNNIALSQVPVVTKISNLLLTGQNNNLHGFCGVPLTAINTCEAILGVNHVINRINGTVG